MHRRIRLAPLVILLCILGAVCFLFTGKEKKRNFRQIAQQLAKQPSPSATLKGLHSYSELFNKTNTGYQKQMFWELVSQGALRPETTPPLLFLPFLKQALTRLESAQREPGATPAESEGEKEKKTQEKKGEGQKEENAKTKQELEFLLGYFLHTRSVCPVPLAAGITDAIHLLPAELQVKAVKVISLSRYSEAVSKIKQAKNTISQGAWKCAQKRLFPIHSAVASDVATAAQLAGEHGTSTNAALIHMRLFWRERYLHPLCQALKKDSELPIRTRCLALSALGLSESSTAIEVLLKELQSNNIASATCAAEALRLISGQSLPDPNPEGIFEPSRSPYACARKWYMKTGKGGIKDALFKAVEGGHPYGLRALVEKAEAGLLRRPEAVRSMENLCRKYSTLPEGALPFVAYASGYCFSSREPAEEHKTLLVEMLAGCEDNMERLHVLWSMRRVAGAQEPALLAETLLELPPLYSASRRICSHLMEEYATLPSLDPSQVVNAFPNVSELTVKQKWRLSVILRRFPCGAALEKLGALSTDSNKSVREAARDSLRKLEAGKQT